jgi:ABC transporter substrate binding protein (PQQ-dependent alcohol dehydrogenase system)
MVFHFDDTLKNDKLKVGSLMKLNLVLGTLLWLACSQLPVGAATITVGVLGVQDDARYQTRRLEHQYPGQPGGRPLDGAAVAVEESASELEAVGHKLQVKSFMAASAADLPKVIAQMKAAQVQHVLLDLPSTEIKALMGTVTAVLGPSIYFNIGAAADDLRGAGCFPNLLHSYPSEAMRSDALAQYLAVRSWNQALVLYGPLPEDKPQLDAFLRSAKRYGVKVVKQTAFKLSADPRERAMSNVRLLTNDKSYDVVVVIDSDGEFARGLPYNTQFPRPVLGANGLTALAWHPQWNLNGGPQLSRRFIKAAGRPMTGQDWAAWVALKSIVGVLTENPKATPVQQLQMLLKSQVFVDGVKGPRLSYRAWDGQLRQPVFLGFGDGVAAVAPFDGVMHPTEVLDTLGVDEKESACRNRP